MHIAVFDWFGWSLLWITPLLWRLLKARWMGAKLLGPGTIRLWLGALLLLCASSALEASLRMDGVTPLNGDFFGQLLAQSLIRHLGELGAALSLIAVTAFALWRYVVGLLRAPSQEKTPADTPQERKEHTTASLGTQPTIITPTPSFSQPRAARAPMTSSRKKSWSLPSPDTDDSFPKARSIMRPTTKNVTSATSTTNATSTTSGRSMGEWATIEQIIPTSAMRSRFHAEQAAQNARRAMPVHGKAVLIHRSQPPKISSSNAALVKEESISVPNLIANIEPAPITPDVSMIETLMETMTISAPQTDTAASAMLPIDLGEITLISPKPHQHEARVAIDENEIIDLDDFHAPQGLLQSRRIDSPGIDLPGLDLLDPASTEIIAIAPEWLSETGILIEQRLKEFKVPVTVLGHDAGPVITRFEVEPAIGVRGSQIVGLMKDLSRALGMTSIRVVETIPGKTCMGLELPNAKRQMIRLSEILESPAYQNSASHLTLALGKDITGHPIVADLAKAPHMLVAGTTGSGKSVAINAMILSLLYKATPEEVRLIMIDPKMLELSVYEGIPHLLAPVVTDMKLAANALTWCVTEMDKRYRLMSALGVRNLAGFNQKIRDGERHEKKVTNPFSLTPDAPEPLSTLPMIVVIIDELADLMMVAGKKIEELIARLAQKARAAGIHLILATQRPSVDVITGLIKANIPTRVAFQVSSKIDSRTILDQMGAEALLGHGDMLFLPPGSGYPQRVHGAFVSDEEVHRVVEYLKQFGEPEYEEAILAGAPTENANGDLLGDGQDVEADPLYDEAVAFVLKTRRASISSVQRHLRVGYNRAARLVEQMEAAGIVSAMATSGSRDVLAPAMAE